MSKNTISVLVATDDNGCQWLAPLLVSIKKTTASMVDVYVFYKDLSDENQSKLNQVIDKSNIKIKFVKMTDNFDFYIPKQWPLPTLFRLKADSVLADLDKIIYLDIDTLVYKDLQNLWNIDLGDNYIGGCYGLDKDRDLGKLDPQKKVTEYFNSGVLLMNLKKMRQDKIGYQCIQMLKKFNTLIRAVDQDVLNVICAKKIMPLSISWNWYISIVRRKNKKLKKIFGKYFSSEPAIIHYYSQYKPNRLFIYFRHPIATYRSWMYQKFFWECVRETPYKIVREIKVKW